MPQVLYRCPECTAEFADVTTRRDCGRCECGAMGEAMDAITAGSYLQSAADKNLADLPPGEVAAVMARKREYEAQSDKILSGELTIKEVGPRELRPQCPENMRRRYY